MGDPVVCRLASCIKLEISHLLIVVEAIPLSKGIYQFILHVREMVYLILKSCIISVVAVVHLAFMTNHGEEIVCIQSIRTKVAVKSGCMV